jgi:hypothetical protein
MCTGDASSFDLVKMNQRKLIVSQVMQFLSSEMRIGSLTMSLLLIVSRWYTFKLTAVHCPRAAVSLSTVASNESS